MKDKGIRTKFQIEVNDLIRVFTTIREVLIGDSGVLSRLFCDYDSFIVILRDTHLHVQESEN